MDTRQATATVAGQLFSCGVHLAAGDEHLVPALSKTDV